jgi:hypothetical protein
MMNPHEGQGLVGFQRLADVDRVEGGAVVAATTAQLGFTNVSWTLLPCARSRARRIHDQLRRTNLAPAGLPPDAPTAVM